MWKKYNRSPEDEELYLGSVTAGSPFSFKHLTLSQKIVVLITLVVCIALLPASMFTTQRVAKVVYDRVSINAVSINNILCNSDEIKEGLLVQNAVPTDFVDANMTAYVNDVDSSDEAGVIIYDKHLRRRVFYNPGGLTNFEQSALELVNKYAGKDSITWRENYAIPNKALGFVKDDNNETIGYVVTGYSDNILNKSTIDAVFFLLLTCFLGLIVGIAGAVFLARNVKQVLFGYEPEEIAAMLQERNIILNSVREGVININSHGIIMLLNTEAKLLLQQSGFDRPMQMVGKPAKRLLENVELGDIIKNGRTLLDASAKIGNTLFIITAVPMVLGHNIIGAVITFRKKSQVEEMANQLTGFKNYATALRAQTHEFMNKMHVIMGLIDMKAYDELKKFTQEIAYNRQSEVSYIVTRLKDITLSGFILGKISRSRELDIEFSLTEESELHNELEIPSVHDIVLIAGNIIENAFDVLRNFDGERIVNLSILDFDREIVIIVEDSGPGMSEETRANMYRHGYSSKGEGHGFGLYLVKHSIENLNGSITVESAPGEGTTFTVRLPVKKDGEIND